MGDKMKLRVNPDDLVGCQKGCCTHKATREATYTYGRYRADGGGTVTMESCDQHGGEPAVDLPQAAEAREYNGALTVDKRFDIGGES